MEAKIRTITKRQTFWCNHVQAAVVFGGTFVKYADLHNLNPKIPACGKQHGRIRIENNLCENAVKHFVMGRKSWLFTKTLWLVLRSESHVA